MSDTAGPSWFRRHALGVVAVLPLAPSFLGSVFNIWYNILHIRPLLSDSQAARFHDAVFYYNVSVYPVGVAAWLWVVFSISGVHQAALRGEPAEVARLRRARARAINLPWWFALVLSIGWLGCIPAFLWALSHDAAPIHPDLPIHLTISLIIACLIAITQGVLLIELTSHRLLYPVLFGDEQPFRTPGATPISLRRRGMMWAISAGACPIVSLLMLAMIDAPGHAEQDRWFTIAVGAVGIAFGLISAGLMSQLVVRPVEVLRDASSAVASGDLSTRVRLLRADEFGPLIDEFNHMVGEMRAKQELRETFGLHVGREAAEQILARDPGLGGRAQAVSVLFCDIRGFTAWCVGRPPADIVAMLNRFFTRMVTIVEQDHGGMVNKFLGDGFMAVFNAAGDRPGHSLAAVTAGCQMLREIGRLNSEDPHPGEDLSIGIGIHAGETIVGNIGSAQRLEYTAIGETVNLASRIESLTKTLGEPLLITQAVRQALPDNAPVQRLAPQRVRGLAGEVAVYAVDVQRMLG